ncbi:MAG: hypothetical protein H7061_06035 [Bdellovibrionaceae bacterium]|nr:hypothetical protein [Bdellovibrio sp.]
MRKKHLELVQKDKLFFIQINTWVGRVSLLFDHPVFNWVLAKNLKNKFYKTEGEIRLIPMRQKDLFIMEDINDLGFKAQNFVFASSDISEQIIKLKTTRWLLEHLFEFITKSISIFYLVVFFFAHLYVERNYGTIGMIQLGTIFGPLAMVILPTLYYSLWSSRTRSSFLKFFFRFELMLMIVTAVAFIMFFTLLKQ